MAIRHLERFLIALSWCAVGAFGFYTFEKFAKRYNIKEFDESSNSSTQEIEESNVSRKNQVPPKISKNLFELVGNTPMICLESLSRETGCIILGKAEFMNPCGSSKDRVAASILKRVQNDSAGHKCIIYEGTVGSTGISLACLCLPLGFQTCICLPDDVSTDKINLLKILGAKLRMMKPTSIVDRDHYVNVAKRLAEQHSFDCKDSSSGFFANQFENLVNWEAHYATTGPEIYEQAQGKIDAFVIGSGTGGTISGVGKYLKERLPDIKIVLADPQGSGLFNKVKYGVMFDEKEQEGTRRRNQIDTLVEGIGCNRITANFEVGCGLIDDAYRVTDEEAVLMSRYLISHEGLFLGTSSAVHCAAAVKLARKMKSGSVIVTLLCDGGERYLSKFYNSEYLKTRSISVNTPTNLDFLNSQEHSNGTKA